MSGKAVVFITGANTGLGYETVKALCQSSSAYEIVIGSRSLENGEMAVSTLKQEVSNTISTFSALEVDLSSDDSIQKAFDDISSRLGKVDVLINSAGAGFDRKIQDGSMSIREGWNAAWDTNVSGTQVLTSTFIPLLLKSSEPRLLFVTSGTASIAETERFDNEISKRINGSPEAGWPKKEQVNPITCYRSSKTGLNMMMREWHRILGNDGVKVFCISPGFLVTGLGGVGTENLKKMGARDPSVGGNFIKDVVQGKRDDDVGKVIRENMIQPW